MNCWLRRILNLKFGEWAVFGSTLIVHTNCAAVVLTRTNGGLSMCHALGGPFKACATIFRWTGNAIWNWVCTATEIRSHDQTVFLHRRILHVLPGINPTYGNDSRKLHLVHFLDRRLRSRQDNNKRTRPAPYCGR